jgi:hypothetical protein
MPEGPSAVQEYKGRTAGRGQLLGQSMQDLRSESGSLPLTGEDTPTELDHNGGCIWHRTRHPSRGQLALGAPTPYSFSGVLANPLVGSGA